MKTFFVIFGILLVNISQASMSKKIFVLIDERGVQNDRFSIVAADITGKSGIVKKDFMNQEYCLASYQIVNSGSESVMRLYYFWDEQSYVGNCHNYTVDIQLQGVDLRKLLLGEEVKIIYSGIRTFSAKKQGTLIRVE